MQLTFLLSEEDEAAFLDSELTALATVYGDYLDPVTAEVELSLVGMGEMQALNKETRSIDEPTDVLSFPLLEGREEIISQDPSAPVLIGSIVICPEKAGIYGETLPQLVHHGLLHLCGFDHETDREAWLTEEAPLIGNLTTHGLTVPGIPQ
ncbi:MAG: rRNA maturation RNase YbeY [bacterium]